ncbi:hypothetical protein V7S76_00490 [Aquirufa sp. ROCK2-A2]
MAFKFNFRTFLAVLLTIVCQIVFLRDLSFGSYAFCFIYLWSILKAPFEFKPVPLILLAFTLGWMVDIFYNTHGIHAVACVAIAYLRPYLINKLTPANGYDERSQISLKDMTWLWFLPYVFVLLIIHHLIIFLLESSDSSLLGISVIRAISSSVLNLVLFVVLELFSKNEVE